ncbi:MAG: diguanylate cyclase, partial [Candidatus Omnitrophota bacterium]
MFCAKSRGRLIFKSISILVVLCFFTQDIAWAVNGASLWSVINGNRVLDANTRDFTNLAKIRIPDDYGIIKEIHNAGSDKVIINIQDTHSNLNAQESISKLLETLEGEYNLKLVSLEGALGPVDTSLFQSHPDNQPRRDIAYYFMGRGKINAAEYYKISRDSAVNLFGAEDDSLYRANVKAYIKSLNNKGRIHKAVMELKKAVSDLKQRVYSKTLKQLDSKKGQYKADDISFKEYWKYLGGLSRSFKLDISDYANVKAILEASDIEERTDFAAAERERQALIGLLGKTLPKEDAQSLLSEAMSFKLGRIEPAVFHSRIRQLADASGIDIALYPNLSLYTDYVSRHSDVIIDDLFMELDELVFAIQEKCFTNADERLLADLSRRLDIIIDLLDAKIVNSDLSYYNSRKEDFYPKNIYQDISRLMLKYNVSDNLSEPVDVITQALPNVEMFYALAGKRDTAMVNNTLAKMESDNRQLAVMVTGGFHTKGIAQILRQRGISYMVILPKFSKAPLERPYNDIILNKREPFEDILSKGDYYLQTPSVFSGFQPVSELKIAFLTFCLLAATIECEGRSAVNLLGDQFIIYKEKDKVDIKCVAADAADIPDLTQATVLKLKEVLNNWRNGFRINEAVTLDDLKRLIEHISEKAGSLSDVSAAEQRQVIENYKNIIQSDSGIPDTFKEAAQAVEEQQFQRAVFDLFSETDQEAFKVKRDRLIKTFGVSRVLNEIKARKDALALDRLAYTDHLTGVYNRAYLEKEYAKQVAKCQCDGTKLSYIMFDIDHFKNVNDTYGHLAGDFILKELCKLILGYMRSDDTLARIGGEEFVILCPELGAEAAQNIIAEKLRVIIQNHKFEFQNGGDIPKEIPITVSFGIADYKFGECAPEEVPGNADNALYAAKLTRNVSVIFTPDLKSGKSSSAGILPVLNDRQERQIKGILEKLRVIRLKIDDAQQAVSVEITKLDGLIAILGGQSTGIPGQIKDLLEENAKEVTVIKQEAGRLSATAQDLRLGQSAVDDDEISKCGREERSLEGHFKKISSSNEFLIGQSAWMRDFENLLQALRVILDKDSAFKDISSDILNDHIDNFRQRLFLTASKTLRRQISDNKPLIINKLYTILKLQLIEGIDMPFRLSLFRYSSGTLSQRARALSVLYPNRQITPALFEKYNQISPESIAEVGGETTHGPVSSEHIEAIGVSGKKKEVEIETESGIQDEDNALKGILDSNPDIADFLKEEINILQGLGMAQKDILYKLKVQIPAAQKMAKALMFVIPTGFGKSLSIRLSTFILAKQYGFNSGNNMGVLIATTSTELSERDALNAGKTLSKFGLSVGVLSQDDSGKNTWKAYDAGKESLGEAKGPSDVTYGTIDKFVHTLENEELAYDGLEMVLSSAGKKYFLLFDEADVPLAEQLMTPFILSGPAKGDAEKIRQRYIYARRIALEIVKGQDMPAAADAGLIDISQRALRKIILTPSGNAVLKVLLSQDAYKDLADTALIDVSDFISWKMLVEQALSVEFAYTKGVHYDITSDNKIVLIDEYSGQRMPGRRLQGGYHSALEAKHQGKGVDIESEPAVINTMTLTGFLNSPIIAGFAGCSGTMDKDFMEKVHGKKVVEPKLEEAYKSLRNDIVGVYLTESLKWAGFYADIIENIFKGLPVLVNVKEGMADAMLEGITKAYDNKYGIGEFSKKFLNKNQDIRIFDASSEPDIKDIEENAGKPGTITIVTNRAARGVDIRQERIVENALDEMCAILAEKGVQSYSTYIHKLQATDMQFRGRIARLPGSQGTWKAFWSSEDSIFEEFKDIPAVQTALNSLRDELKMHGESIAADSFNQPHQIVNLIHAARTAIRDAQIRQYEDGKRFEDEINDKKKAIMVFRRYVFNGEYDNEELNKLIPGIAKTAGLVPEAEKEVFRRGILAVFDKALSDYLDIVSDKRVAIMQEIAYARVRASVTQADPFGPFVTVSQSAYDKIIDYIRRTILSAISQAPVSEEAPKRAPPISRIKKAFGLIFGSGIIAAGWVAISKIMPLFNVTRLLTQGSLQTAIIPLNAIAGASSFLPASAWIILAAVSVVSGLTLYHTRVKLFNQVYLKDAKTSLTRVFRGVFTPKDLVKAVLSIPAMLLSMFAAAGPMITIFALVSVFVYPASAAILFPLAVTIGLASMLTGLLMTFNPWVAKRLKSEKLETPSDAQRGIRSFSFGIGFIAVALGVFTIAPTMEGVASALLVLSLASFTSKLSLSKFYDQSLEDARTAKKSKFVGAVTSFLGFALLAGLSLMMSASPAVFSAVSLVFSIPLALIAVLCLVAIPYMSSRFARVETQTLGVSHKLATAGELVQQGLSNIRVIFIGLMAAAGITVALASLVVTAPLWVTVVSGLGFAALTAISAGYFIKYGKTLKTRIEKGDKLKGIRAGIASLFVDPGKLVQGIMSSAVLSMAGPSLGAGCIFQTATAQSPYAQNSAQQLIDKLFGLFDSRSDNRGSGGSLITAGFSPRQRGEGLPELEIRTENLLIQEKSDAIPVMESEDKAATAIATPTAGLTPAGAQTATSPATEASIPEPLQEAPQGKAETSGGIPSPAEQLKTVKALYKEGVDFYNYGQYDSALAKFNAVLDIASLGYQSTSYYINKIADIKKSQLPVPIPTPASLSTNVATIPASDTTSQPAAPAGAQTATSPATEASIPEPLQEAPQGKAETSGGIPSPAEQLKT